MLDLFTQTNDAALCEGIRKLIINHYSQDPDVATMPDEVRVVWLVLLSTSAIQSGGFRSLFDKTIPGDPSCSLCAKAFSTLGSAAAIQAFREAFAIFPNSKPPIFHEKRLDLFQAQFKTGPAPMDALFLAALEDVNRRLSGYIRAHRAAFTHLARPQSTNETQSNKAGVTEDRKGPSKAAQRIEALPHWARVALAAHCGQRVHDLFADNWPSAPHKYAVQLHAAIELAEQCASDAEILSGLDEAIRQSAQAASAAQAVAARIDLPAFAIAVAVARVAEKAASAARAGSQQSAAYALEAYQLARQAAKDAHSDAIAETLKEDLLKLAALAKRQKWKDVTPVPALAFS